MKNLRDFPKNMKDMSPEEETEYINQINEDFRYFIEAVPFVEIGDTTDGEFIKLKGMCHEGTYRIFEILFELQWNLHMRKKKTGEDDLKLIVSELSITADISNEHFCPVRGLMIHMKYEKR